MSRTNGRGIGSRILGAVTVAASVLMITVIVGGFGHLDSAGALPSTSVKVCKAGNVTGSFPFSVNNGPTFSIPVGHCVIKAVSAGENGVKEVVDRTGVTKLQSINVTPTSASVVEHVLNSSSLAGYARVNVASGATVTVTFTNRQALAKLEVCKVAGDQSTANHSFQFTESTAAGVIASFSLTALLPSDNSGANCSKPQSYQIGTHVTVTELGLTGFTLTGISPTNPQGVNGNVSLSNVVLGTAGAGGSAEVTILPTTAGTQASVVTLTNKVCCLGPPAEIKVCVYAGDSTVQGSFNFSLTGVNNVTLPSMSIPVGQCSYDSAPVGQVQVTEAQNAPFYLDYVSNNAVQENLDKGEATFEVQANTITEADFWNATSSG